MDKLIRSDRMAAPFAGPGSKWSKFVLSILQQYRKAGLYCDASLESADGEDFKVHMCIFAAACPLLYPVASCTGNKYLVKLPLDASDVSCVVEYIYTGELLNGPDHATSNAFQVLGLSYLPSSQWSSYLWARIVQFQQAQLLCNVTLVSSEGNTLTAHSSILAATSALCRSLIPSDASGLISVETSVSKTTLQFMLTYLYTGLMDHLASYLQKTGGNGVELGSVYQDFMFAETNNAPSQNAPIVKKKLPTKGTPKETKSNTSSKKSRGKQKSQASGPSKKRRRAKRKKGKKEGKAEKPAKHSSPLAAVEKPEHRHKTKAKTVEDQDEDLWEPAEEFEDEPQDEAEDEPQDEAEDEPQNEAGTGKDQDSVSPVKKTQYQHQCTVCSKEFKSLSRLQTHERLHTGIKAHPCPFCSKLFSTIQGVKRHENFHTKEQCFICDICGKSYHDVTSLNRHRLKHNRRTAFLCKQCGKALGDSSALKCHELIHGEKKSLMCQYCGKGFHTTGNLRTHERIHTGEKPFVCRFCEKKFAVACSLRRHERLHTGDKPYQCKECTKAFAQLTSLKLHMRKHGTGKYRCTICKEDFTMKSDLKKHEKLLHSSEQLLYNCPSCEKVFTKANHLRKHANTCEGTSCVIMNKTFPLNYW